MSAPESEAIDISHWNPITNWDEIPDFALWCMKATEGEKFRSPVFDERWPEIRERQVQFRGAYHWIRSDSSATKQFKNLKKAIDDHGGLQMGEFVMLDWETTPGIADVKVKDVSTWLKLAEQEWPGRIIVYCSDWVPGFIEWRNANPTYPLWYANYNTGTSRTGGAAESDQFGADVWQWTSTALVPGFQGGIDMNDVLDWDTIAVISGAEYKTPAPPVHHTDEEAIVFPPYTPPSSWGIFPLDPEKPYLKQTPARTTQSKAHVTYLQDALQISSDGWFGPMTTKAVNDFQRWWSKQGVTIHIDAEVGPETWPLVDLTAVNRTA